MTRSAEAGVVRPRVLCFAVATARQSVCGLDPVVSPCRMVCGVAAALRRWVPHGGGLLRCGAVCSSRFPISARPYPMVAK
jgi:hypothetical protein